MRKIQREKVGEVADVCVVVTLLYEVMKDARILIATIVIIIAALMGER